jgi:phosphomannomutase
MKKFVFDVDGTLTPSRQKIDPIFKDWLIEFCINYEVYIVTGSDYPKAAEQLGEQLILWPIRVYGCSGSEVWEGGELIRSSEWKPPRSLYQLMEGWLQASKFVLRTGQHIEHRPGMINFSIVGRGATLAERKLYVEYDRLNRERETIAHIINSNYKDITATVGGETGIDIHPTGADKSQILMDFDLIMDKIIFFGDRMEQGGNDYPLAKANKTGKNYHVKDWKHTWEILKTYDEGKS